MRGLCSVKVVFVFPLSGFCTVNSLPSSIVLLLYEYPVMIRSLFKSVHEVGCGLKHSPLRKWLNALNNFEQCVISILFIWPLSTTLYRWSFGVLLWEMLTLGEFMIG